jgi:ubiquinone/menaquinone biosynthesis C-methylase UbiE
MTTMNDATSAQQGHRWFAAAYALQMRMVERGPLGRWRKELLSDLQGDVLEIGAGTGANFTHYPASARVTAFEPDPFMLKRAQAAIIEHRLTTVDVRHAAAESLPVHEASFDVVVSTLVLCTVEDPARSLQEIKRVLRPGGELRFIEHVRGEGFLARAQDFIQPAWGWMGAGCHANRPTEQTIRDAGFEITELSRHKLAPWLPAIVGRARRRG